MFGRFVIGVILLIATVGQAGFGADRDQKEKVRIVVTEKKVSQSSDTASQSQKARQENRNSKQ
jgi:hypothetical protein